MPRIPYTPIYTDEIISNKKVEDLLDKTIIVKDPNRIKRINQKAAKNRAEKLGIDSSFVTADKIRNQINERIIQEIKQRKLRHIDVASISLIPRSKITAIMNRKLNKTSTDLLIKILGILGVSISAKFE